MQTAVLATPCFTLPLVKRTICTGLPDPQSTLISRPSLFGLSLGSERAFAWFSLGVLIVSVLMARVWRDRGIARRLIAVRDVELDPTDPVGGVQKEAVARSRARHITLSQTRLSMHGHSSRA